MHPIELYRCFHILMCDGRGKLFSAWKSNKNTLSLYCHFTGKAKCLPGLTALMSILLLWGNKEVSSRISRCYKISQNIQMRLLHLYAEGGA